MRLWLTSNENERWNRMQANGKPFHSCYCILSTVRVVRNMKISNFWRTLEQKLWQMWNIQTDLEGEMQTIEDLLRANGAFFLSKNANFLQYLSFFMKRFILNNSIPTFCFGVLRGSLCFDLLWCMSYFSNECLTFVNNQNSCSSANFACLFLFSSQSHKHLLLPFYSTHHWWFIQSGVHLVFVM